MTTLEVISQSAFIASALYLSWQVRRNTQTLLALVRERQLGRLDVKLFLDLLRRRTDDPDKFPAKDVRSGGAQNEQ